MIGTIRWLSWTAVRVKLVSNRLAFGQRSAKSGAVTVATIPMLNYR